MPPVEDLCDAYGRHGGIAANVPSSLTNNRDIDSILRAADEIQDEDATISRIWTVLEQLSSEVSPEDADRLIPAECEVQLESARSSSEMNLLTLGASSHKIEETSNTAEGDHMLVPAIPAGVSGTALAASLLRDGWSLAKLYAKYQEAVDALCHEELARKDAEAVMARVLYEIEEQTPLILDERAEHKRLMEAYSAANQKLQHSQSEQTSLQKTILDLKVAGLEYLNFQEFILLKDMEDFISLRSCMLTASRIIFQAPGIPSAEERERQDKWARRRMLGLEEEPNNGGKPLLSLNVDTQTQPATRKRSTFELAGPQQKKSKGQYPD